MVDLLYIGDDFNMYDYKYFIKRDGIGISDFVQGNIDYHTHYFYELAYVKSGKLIHYLNDEKYEISTGDYFIIDIGCRHKYELLGSGKAEICNCLFLPEIIDKSLKHCKRFSVLIENYLIKFKRSILNYDPTTYIFHDDDGSILNSLEKIKTESKGMIYGYQEMLRCTLIEIFITTMRKIINEKKASEIDTITNHIIKFIEKNFDKKISLSDISISLNYSLPYISSKFKADTGYNFSYYLQKYRIEQSTRLLANTDKPISEIASLVGYDDVKFFGKLFKKYMYVTPSEFRKGCNKI